METFPLRRQILKRGKMWNDEEEKCKLLKHRGKKLKQEEGNELKNVKWNF